MLFTRAWHHWPMVYPEPLPGTSDWLDPFLADLRSNGPRIVEIGCGPGLDAAALLGAGFDVTGFDRSPQEIVRARQQAPGATLLLADLSALPFRDSRFDAAVSSLALHYLHWEATRAAFGEVRRLLRPGSPFLFRVNATDDVNYGALDGTAVEHHFRETPGTYGPNLKRFFDEADVRAAVDGMFAIEHLAHRTIHRYESPKQCWECFARAL